MNLFTLPTQRNTKWIKRVPDPDGSYWCRWKGKNGWQTSVAQVLTLGPYGPALDPERYDSKGRSKYDRIVTVSYAGTLSIRKGYTERQARVSYGFEEALFWPVALVPPDPPKSHRRKRKAK